MGLVIRVSLSSVFSHFFSLPQPLQANPANRAAKGIKNALELFKFNSVHGGLWRAAYKVDSIGEVSAMIYFIGGPKAFLPVVYFVLALIAFVLAKFVLKVI